MHLAVSLMLGAPVLFDFLDELLDVLNAIFRGDEHGIFCLNNDMISQAEGRHQPTLGKDKATLGIDREDIAT